MNTHTSGKPTTRPLYAPVLVLRPKEPTLAEELIPYMVEHGPRLAAEAGHSHGAGVVYDPAAGELRCRYGTPLFRLVPVEREVALVRRGTGLSQCGRPYATKQAAERTKRGQSGNWGAIKCRFCPAWHLERSESTEETGFPAKVKAMIRLRAGDCCEACGVSLPPGFGNIQHRCARQMGGTSLALINSVVNGVLLCGTPLTGDHGLCEARDPEMHEHGFWLKRNESPLEVPILWRGEFGGFKLWLTETGEYSEYSPAARGAA